MERCAPIPTIWTHWRRFELTKRDLGYTMLLTRYVEDPRDGGCRADQPGRLGHGARCLGDVLELPRHGGAGLLLHRPVRNAFIVSVMRKHETRWFLKLALISLPLPWVAAELGWLLAEYGRQPWIIEGVLPTFLGVSSLSASQIILTMVGFTVLYGALAVVEVMLMVHLHPQGALSRRDGRPRPTGWPNGRFRPRSRPSRRIEIWKSLCPTKCCA
jgi:cytochrome d ubiquinol oxidase subunit I